MAKGMEKVLWKSGLTPKVIIAIVIMIFLGTIIQFQTQALGGAPGWVYMGWLPLPLLIYMALSFLLAKVWKGFELTQQEWVCFTIANVIVAGFYYGMYTTIAFGIPDFGAFTIQIPAYIVHEEPTASAVGNLIPTWMSPQAGDLTTYFYGGAVNWGAWMAPIVFYIAFECIYIILFFSWGMFLRKPLVETEALTFPNIQHTLRLINYQAEKADGKSLLFSIGRFRLFWVAFVVGILYHLTDIVRLFVAAAPPSTYIDVINIDITPFTRGALPGAGFAGTLRLAELAIWYFVPMDFLISATVFWLALYIIYPVIVVYAGAAPYSPGNETDVGGWLGWNQGPFKFNLFAGWGVTIGVGIYMFWANRQHFANILRSAWNAGPYAGQEDAGLSYKFLGMLTIILTVAFLILLLGASVPPIVAIAIIAISLLYHFGWSRMMGDVMEYWGSPLWYRQMYYDVGVLTAGWNATPPTATTSVMNTMILGASQTERTSGVMQANWIGVQAMALRNNTSAKDVLFTSALTVIVMTIIAIPFTIWFTTAMGGRSVISTVPRDAWWPTSLAGYSGAGTPWPPVAAAERYGLLVAGIVVAFALFMLRLRFPWFIISPTALITTPIMSWFWADLLLMLVIKYFVLRIGGAKLYERGVPFCVGFLSGRGISYTITQIIVWAMTAMPTFLAKL